MFTGMIILGLLAIFLVSYFDRAEESTEGGLAETCENGEVC